MKEILEAVVQTIILLTVLWIFLKVGIYIVKGK
jgi:hypothetical protein